MMLTPRTYPNKSCHLGELTKEPAIWSCDTSQLQSCFDSCQLTILRPFIQGNINASYIRHVLYHLYEHVLSNKTRLS